MGGARVEWALLAWLSTGCAAYLEDGGDELSSPDDWRAEFGTPAYGYSEAIEESQEERELAEYSTGAPQGQQALPAVRSWVIVCPAAPPSLAPIIDRTIKRHNNDLRVCYNRALRRDGSLRGRVALQFMIGNDGRVPAVVVTRSEIDDPRMMRCLGEAVKRWRFDLPSDAGASFVTKPFVFSIPPETRTAHSPRG